MVVGVRSRERSFVGDSSGDVDSFNSGLELEKCNKGPLNKLSSTEFN